MSPEMWLALGGQTVVLLIAIIGAAIRADRRITTLEGQVRHIELTSQMRSEQEDRLANQVQGISRSVAQLEGAHRTCPYWNFPGSTGGKQPAK